MGFWGFGEYREKWLDENEETKTKDAPESPHEPSPVPAPTRRVVLYGAIGRHNFGDLIMAEVHRALIQITRPELSLVFADLLAADMTPYGAQKVEAITDLFGSPEYITDVIHVGGDTLGVTIDSGLDMIGGSKTVQTRARKKWLALDFELENRSAYLLQKLLFTNPGTFVVDAVGGVMWPDDVAALTEADYVSARNPIRGVQHVPDSVVLLYNVLATEVLAARSSASITAVHQATKGRPYWAVQLSDEFATAYGNSTTIVLADQICTATQSAHYEKGVAIVLFRAGAIHDSLPTLNNVKALMKKTCASDIPIVVFEELNIFCICAVIAEAALLMSTSLHARIVALNYHVPRVTFSAKPEVSKHSFFVHHWDDLYASEHELAVRRGQLVNCTEAIQTYEGSIVRTQRSHLAYSAPLQSTSLVAEVGVGLEPCEAEFRVDCGWNKESMRWNTCGGVIPVGLTADAIIWAVDYGRTANWTTAQSDRLANLVPMQQAAVEKWMPLL